MQKTILAVLCAVGIGASFGAAARGPGEHGGPMDRTDHRGQMEKMQENSNGRFAGDREFGLDRAAERRNEHATEREKADDAKEKRK